MQEFHLNISTVYNTITVPCTPTTTAEDVCIYTCKQLGILNVARHLFALRLTTKPIFLIPSATFVPKHETCEFRLRFKPANILKLCKVDEKAYEYYFQQARSDVFENKIPDIVFEKHKRELLGLGIADMYRVMVEKDIPRETIESDYKKYIPKEVIKKHSIFIKKPIRDYLQKLNGSGHDSNYVRAQYIKQLDLIVPEYLSETYRAHRDENGIVSSIHIKVSPFHPTEPGIRCTAESKKDTWVHICTIEDLIFVSIRKDGTLEINRKNDKPCYLKFSSTNTMLSFISCLDGYYRLTCKWTFNICKEVFTPSIQKLHALKCHGPVGGEFSYAKIEGKRNNRHGCFILRESEAKYDNYFIDVCVKDGAKPKTFNFKKVGEEYIFNTDNNKYKNIKELMSVYNKPEGAIYLQECLPASEYDISPLLLCRSDSLVGDSLTDTSDVNLLVPTSPVCINWKDLQVYKGQKKEGSSGLTTVFRSMWKLTKGKKMEVAMKMLKKEFADQYLKDFINLAGQWAFLQSPNIVRLYGITLTSNVSYVTDYFKLGPLDVYLRQAKNIIKEEDLIEAAGNLAAALWYLKENGIVHGKIRCRKLMVAKHDDESFLVKLGDPGIVQEYSSREVHWIPLECYNLEFNNPKRSTGADVWAFATTLWEIFKYGEEIPLTDHVQTMNWYNSGKRLGKPPKCPSEIYSVMLECWDADPHRRKQPQAIMRDINQFLYQVYNSRRAHAYSKISKPFVKASSSSMQSIAGTSSISINSNATESTFIEGNDVLIEASEITNDAASINSDSSQNWMVNATNYYTSSYDLPDLNLLSEINFPTATTSLASLDSLSSIQSIFELDDDCNVVLQGRIGQGFYGEVYKGTLEYLGDKSREPCQVAIKKLKSTAFSSACLEDFEREINIMKKLEHKNIVSILGVLREPEILLVMEFVQHGSLQSYLKIHSESLQEKQLLKYAFDIALGMEYLGTKSVVHRDLAARNILVVDDSHVKISDFGLAQSLGPNDYYILKTIRDLPIKWYAPESLRDGKFSVKSDVWSYGITLCEMFSWGEEPCYASLNAAQDEEQQKVLLEALESGERLPCPKHCPQAVYTCIIHPCWEANPKNRPTFRSLAKDVENLLQQF